MPAPADLTDRLAPPPGSAVGRSPLMNVACCVCHVHLGYARCAPWQDGETTHGYCAACFAQVMDELEKSFVDDARRPPPPNEPPSDPDHGWTRTNAEPAGIACASGE